MSFPTFSSITLGNYIRWARSFIPAFFMNKNLNRRRVGKSADFSLRELRKKF